MAWQERSVVDERLRFAADLMSGYWSMSELCAAYGISRKIGYKWKARYEAEGPSGLLDRSRAPKQHGRATEAALVDLIVAEKLAYPHWGPKKLRARLKERLPELIWPAASTFGEILKRRGLVMARRMKRRPLAQGALTEPAAPNLVWSADHKGFFRTRDGKRCEPLTVIDSCSRMWLALEATGSTSEAEARPVFERLFNEHGLPRVIRTDNGGPFVGCGVTGLTLLSAWWTELGVAHERIDPGMPQQNGRHERAHGAMSPLERAPSEDARAQQQAFDAFRREYNHERPHEALGQVPPARLYRNSERQMPAHIEEPVYPAEAAARRVRSGGEIKWRGGMVFIAHALAGKLVAVEDDEEIGAWRVRFYARPLGVIQRGRLRRSPPPRERAAA